ncbi:MAG: hypothetical protein R2695_02785 [Acidimicrobiales bacterium]
MALDLLGVTRFDGCGFTHAQVVAHAALFASTAGATIEHPRPTG